jgi:hypothetical protein
MNVKKRNTIIFVIVASIFNLVLTVVLLVLGYLLIYWIFKRVEGQGVDVNVFNIFLVLDLIAAIVLSNLIYRGILKLINKKVKFEDHFDPIFKPRNRLR